MGDALAVLGAFFTLLVLSIAAVTEPSHCACPVGFYVNGVTPEGYYTCRIVPREVPSENQRPYRPVPQPSDDIAIGGRIFCTGGQHPIVVSWQVVGCQP